MRKMILPVVLCMALSASAQELTITSKTTDGNGQPTTTTSYITPEHVRMAEPHADVIFDLASGSMTVLDRAKKQYYVVTEKDMDEIAARVHEYMKAMPPEMQQRMQSMSTVNVQKTGQTRTIAGYKCENWTIEAGRMKMDECVTTELKLPAAAWERFRKFTDHMRSMSGGAAGGTAKMMEELAKVKGYPLATTQTMTMMNRTSVATTEVTDISRGPIAASVWQIPPDYQRVDNPMTQAMRQMPPR